MGIAKLFRENKAQRKVSVKWIERYDFLSFQPKVILMTVLILLTCSMLKISRKKSEMVNYLFLIKLN